jgi:hypothetical protein
MRMWVANIDRLAPSLLTGVEDRRVMTDTSGKPIRQDSRQTLTKTVVHSSNETPPARGKEHDQMSNTVRNKELDALLEEARGIIETAQLEGRAHA